MSTEAQAAHARVIEPALEARAVATEAMFAAESARLAELCHRMAERFARGGRLLAVGVSPQARTDVAHVAVEFVHPVIVGKRALPALGLTGETAPVAAELAAHAGADDIVITFGEDGAGGPADAVALGRERGCLTLAFAAIGAEWEFAVPSRDRFVRQELVEVAYHVLWELVHVFFEHRGLLSGRSEQPTHDAGATAFLYPFLAEQETDLDGVLADVAASAFAKARETQALRERTLAGSGDELAAAVSLVRAAGAGDGRVLTFGNGGSATDAADLAVDLMAPREGRPAWPAIDLSQCSAILTAIGNDIGTDAILARQLIAHARAADVLAVFSTSGASRSVIDGLAEARRRGLGTVAFVGYDGGVIAADRLADAVIVSPSQHIPRIQEAQATAAHLVCELVRDAPGPEA